MDRSGKLIRYTFWLGVALKGADGIFEIIGGVLLPLIPPQRIGSLIAGITRHELQEDPGDFLFNLLTRMAQHLSANTEFFVSVYLLAHGAIKTGLVLALLERKLWAYPAAIIFFALFMIYQIYRYFHSHSSFMAILTLLDMFVIVLTLLEYKRLKTAAA